MSRERTPATFVAPFRRRVRERAPTPHTHTPSTKAVSAELIYDVGMHNGDDTAFYLRQGYRVLAIEANPQLAEKARGRFQQEIRDGRLQILNVGIAAEDGEREFWISHRYSDWSSFDRAVASRDGGECHAIVVPTRRFGGIVAEHGVPMYLKIDIEGSDVLCVGDLQRGRLPQYVSLESECGNATEADEWFRPLRLLADLGYRRFKLIDQRTLAPLSYPPNVELLTDYVAARAAALLPRPAGVSRVLRRVRLREQLYRKHGWRFSDGCSGPWGNDTPGRWMTAAEAERTYEFFRRRHFRRARARAYGIWWDWHAALD